MMRKTFLLLSGLVFLFSLILFLVYIQIPASKNFDEFHYIPSSKQFLSGEKNQNWEHPPLGKIIISGGIAVFGDKPFGWRFSSALFGALTAVAMFAWGVVLFESIFAGILLVLFTLSNHLLYVQSRIAMLDSILIFFLIAWIALFHSYWTDEKFSLFKSKKAHLLRLVGIGFCIGIASSIKWYAVSVWACFLMGLILFKLADYWGTRFSRSTLAHSFYPANTISRLRWQELGIYFFIIPIGIYFLSFIPLLLNAHENLKWYEIFGPLQKRMFEGQLNVTNPHPYMSKWYQWPLLLRPIWYHFDKVTETEVRGILLLGNPWLMWLGFLSLFVLAYDFLVTRCRVSFQIITAYLLFFAVWIIIPRKIAFYYYYFPAGMVLGASVIQAFRIIHYFLRPALGEENVLIQTRGAFFQDKTEEKLGTFKKIQWKYQVPLLCFLAICLLTFIYFFPILSGQKIPSGDYLKFTWFRSWI